MLIPQENGQVYEGSSHTRTIVKVMFILPALSLIIHEADLVF